MLRCPNSQVLCYSLSSHERDTITCWPSAHLLCWTLGTSLQPPKQGAHFSWSQDSSHLWGCPVLVLLTMLASCLQEEGSKLFQGSPPSSSETWTPSWFWLSLARKSLKVDTGSLAASPQLLCKSAPCLCQNHHSHIHPCVLRRVSPCSSEGQGCR